MSANLKQINFYDKNGEEVKINFQFGYLTKLGDKILLCVYSHSKFIEIDITEILDDGGIVNILSLTLEEEEQYEKEEQELQNNQ